MNNNQPVESVLSPEMQVIVKIHEAIDAMAHHKPNDRSETDRRYAICKTELEKVLAYFDYWVLEADKR